MSQCGTSPLTALNDLLRRPAGRSRRSSRPRDCPPDRLSPPWGQQVGFTVSGLVGDGGTSVAGGTTAPLGIDASVPTPARMYDFWLGGHDNFAVDRAAALAVSEAVPEVKLTAIENRKFLRRAVRYLA